MKKFGIRLPILCAALLLVGVTALATVVKSVSNLKKEDAHVTVTLKSGSGDPAFTVTRDNATKGKKYLLVIRNGPEEADLTEENTVYMDVETATSDVVTFSNAYPMPMKDGLYRVYMTDYEKNEKNELKQVATFDVGDSGDNGGNSQNSHSGDFDESGGKPNAADVASMINLIVTGRGNMATEAQLAAADFDNDGIITASDVASVISVIVG